MPTSETTPSSRPSRWAPLDPRVAVLPLRLFLGVTFFVAGVQKLADPNFFRARAPGSIQSQLSAAVHTAGLPGLVRLAEQPVRGRVRYADLALVRRLERD